MNHEFYELKIANIKKETPDAVSITLEIPDHLRDTFTYRPGQYLSLKVDVDGEKIRRCYSMSSSPMEPGITITVKRVASGRASRHLCDDLLPGQTLEVMPPEGKFCPDLDPGKRRSYYLFAAGSGITPLMSIIKMVLEQEPMSDLYLLYGNRDEDQIIFREQLQFLEKRYDGQLIVEHILSQPKKAKPGGLTGLFLKAEPMWKGKTGRVDAPAARKFLGENSPRSETSEYYLCGPGNMIDVVTAVLLERGITKKSIRTEHFASSIPGDAAPAPAAAPGEARATVTLNGQTFTLPVKPTATILETLVKAKYDPPYSCTAGSCSTCMAKLLRGTVHMDVCHALDDSEIAAGYILTCQSHPTSDEVEISYDL